MRLNPILCSIAGLFLTAAAASAQASTSPAIRAEPPSGDDSRQYICRGASVPDGFVVTDDIRDRQMCGGDNPNTLNAYNVWVIERYDRKAVNSTMDVCAAMPTPPGWVVVDVFRRKDRCGHPDGMFDVNVKRIRRTQ
jgi:hypothetical protein